MRDEIFNEDCLETMSRMSDGSIDLVVTSPPYDNLRAYTNDIDKTWGEAVWEPIISELCRVIKEGGGYRLDRKRCNDWRFRNRV